LVTCKNISISYGRGGIFFKALFEGLHLPDQKEGLSLEFCRSLLGSSSASTTPLGPTPRFTISTYFPDYQQAYSILPSTRGLPSSRRIATTSRKTRPTTGQTYRSSTFVERSCKAYFHGYSMGRETPALESVMSRKLELHEQ